ncbi:UNVERIFIED_CONTAM: hypothetical protein FKN15_047308 [Acipenser sinensis]
MQAAIGSQYTEQSSVGETRKGKDMASSRVLDVLEQTGSRGREAGQEGVAVVKAGQYQGLELCGVVGGGGGGGG